MSPSDGAHTTSNSYSHSTETMSCAVVEIYRVICPNSSLSTYPTYMQLAPLLVAAITFEFCRDVCHRQTLIPARPSCGVVCECEILRLAVFTCDRQTEGQTDRQTRRYHTTQVEIACVYSDVRPSVHSCRPIQNGRQTVSSSTQHSIIVNLHFFHIERRKYRPNII